MKASPVKALAVAIAFMTRLPVGKIAAFDAADVAHSAGWFPLVGLLLGAIYSAAALLLKDHLPPGVVAALLVILDAAATGALHYDGLADTADGFGGGKCREEVLRIMRDHAVGSYGSTALACLVGLKVTAYAALLKQNNAAMALILTPALGRWSILLLTAALPYARTSSSVIEGMGKRSFLWGSGLMSVALIVAMSGRAWTAMAVVIAITSTFGFYCRRRIGGITGDTLGASVQFSESAVLVTFLWASVSTAVRAA